MTRTKTDALDRVFMALADGTRRRMVHMLAEREHTVSELAQPFDMSLAAVSKHLKVLEKAGLVRRDIRGREHYCALLPERLTGALDWISIYRNFWSRRLDALADVLESESTEDKQDE